MKTVIAKLGMILVVASCVLVAGQEPARDKGAAVTGAFEGWFQNPDGSFTLLFGYFNRNLTEEPDVPIGPNNRIEPGGPDRGQPTHFLPGRQYGLFAVRVPADFGKEDRITWTLVANGHPTSVPGKLHPDYVISPLIATAGGGSTKNTPPVVRFEEEGPSVQGPLAMTVERTTSVATPLTVPVWVADDARVASETAGESKGLPVSLKWLKFRVPGPVTVEPARPKIETLQGGAVGQPFRGKATTSVRFGAPGTYDLALVANDSSGEGGGGFQCCWTTAHVKVVVTP